MIINKIVILKVSIDEDEKSATVKIVIDGLRVDRELKRLFKSYPTNAQILFEYFGESAMNYSFQLDKDKPQNIIYKLDVKKLPGKIDPTKIKIKVSPSFNFKD